MSDIAAALAEQGVEVPEDLRPAEVWPVAAPYRAAFAVLSAARGHSMSGWNAIVYSEIVEYAHANGYAGSIDELEEFVALVQAQDTAFLEEAAKASEQARKARR